MFNLHEMMFNFNLHYTRDRENVSTVEVAHATDV
jgi:hypothetical protein